MTLEEATKLQNELLTLLPEVGFNKYIVSTRLGIDALKREGHRRQYDIHLPVELFPGETTEE